MQTASESIDPRSIEERLEKLKSGVSAVAAAEQALMKSKAERLSALRREAQRHAEVEAERVDVRIHQIAGDFLGKSEAARLAMESRSARIQQAYHASKAAFAGRVQDRKDRRIGRVQGEIMRNRQMRQQELDEAANEHAAFRELLIQDRAERREIRASVWSAFRSFRPWVGTWFRGGKRRFAEVEIPESAEKCREVLAARLEQAREVAAGAGRLPLARLFRYVPLWLLVLIACGVFAWLGLRGEG